MPIDGWRSTAGALTDRWGGLERDWQTVLMGATIVSLVSLLELQIPW